ncbi:4-coumarate--CoA ligase 1-like [Ixodes scapularis]
MVVAMKKYKVTKVFGSPYWIQLLAQAAEKQGIQLDSLTTILLCGSKATPHILRQIERSFDLAIVKETYGATEVGRVCRPPLGATRWYGIGFPSPMVQVKVVDVKSGKVLGPNEEGEVLVKTPCSMKGYYGHPEATSQKITPDGWVRTGDICYYNEDGQFFYVERLSQFFKCMNIQVAPCSIESVLLSHDGIEEAVVIGVPHPRYHEVALAFVVLKKSCSKITEEELQNFVAGQVGTYKHLHGGVKFLDEIPKDANGKDLQSWPALPTTNRFDILQAPRSQSRSLSRPPHDTKTEPPNDSARHRDRTPKPDKQKDSNTPKADRTSRPSKTSTPTPLAPQGNHAASAPLPPQARSPTFHPTYSQTLLPPTPSSPSQCDIIEMIQQALAPIMQAVQRLADRIDKLEQYLTTLEEHPRKRTAHHQINAMEETPEAQNA